MHAIAVLLSLSLAATPVLIVLYVAYRILLSNDGRLNLNRRILTLLPPLALFALPLVRYIGSSVKHTADGSVTVVSVASVVKIPDWIYWVYGGGIAVTLILTIVAYIRILKIVRSGSKSLCGQYTLVISDNETIVPFSWMHYIVVSRKDYELNARLIVLHEKYHLAQHHWLDLVILRCVIIINWFNPTAWLLMEELKSVHEFQADRAVIASGIDSRHYQMLLLSRAAGTGFSSVADSLGNASLKRRIDMMLYPRKHRGIVFRTVGTSIAALAAVTLLFPPGVRAYLQTIESPMATDLELDSTPARARVVYLNGKEITEEEMNSLNPHNIKSVTVRKSSPDSNNSIIIIDYEAK